MVRNSPAIYSEPKAITTSQYPEKLKYIYHPFKNAKITNEVSYEEITELLSNLITVNQNTTWFAEQAEENGRLFADQYKGENTEWASIASGLDLVQRVRSLFKYNVVPESVVAYVCNETQRDSNTSVVAMLSPEKTAEYKEKLSLVSPQWNVERLTINDVIANLDAYETVAVSLSSVMAEIRGYSVSSNASPEELATKVENA